MTHVNLFDPRVFSPLDVLVKDFFNEKAEFAQPDNRTVNQPVDIFEDENGLTFEIACTGIPKELVEIELKGDIFVLNITKRIYLKLKMNVATITQVLKSLALILAGK